MPDARSVIVKGLTSGAMRQLTLSCNRIRQQLSHEEHEEIRQMYSDGVRLSDIAEYIGCSQPTVVLHTTGLPRRNRTWTSEDIQYVKSNPDGYRTKELAAMFMVSQSSIRNIKKRNL